jgi:hypothetical protein
LPLELSGEHKRILAYKKTEGSECMREGRGKSYVRPSSPLIKFSLLNEPEKLKMQAAGFSFLDSVLQKKVSRGKTEVEEKKAS